MLILHVHAITIRVPCGPHERELPTLTTNRRPAITSQPATASDQLTMRSNSGKLMVPILEDPCCGLVTCTAYY
jgi:hypothetical protein